MPTRREMLFGALGAAAAANTGDNLRHEHPRSDKEQLLEEVYEFAAGVDISKRNLEQALKQKDIMQIGVYVGELLIYADVFYAKFRGLEPSQIQEIKSGGNAERINFIIREAKNLLRSVKERYPAQLQGVDKVDIFIGPEISNPK